MYGSNRRNRQIRIAGGSFRLEKPSSSSGTASAKSSIGKSGGQLGMREKRDFVADDCVLHDGYLC